MSDVGVGLMLTLRLSISVFFWLPILASFGDILRLRLAPNRLLRATASSTLPISTTHF